jgi:ketosteroid isomerase-like protein
MTLDYAAAGDLLETLRQLAEAFEGDRLVMLYTDDAAYRPDPFEPAFTGHNDIRAYWVRAAEDRRQTEMTIERHWVSGRTILASWHLSYVRSGDGARVRIHGFTTLDLRDGKIERHREWSQSVVTTVAPG